MSDVANFFDLVADQQTPAPVKRKLEWAEKRAIAKREAEAQLEADEKLARAYGRWRKGHRDALLAGPHGKDVAGILSFLRTMTLSSAPALLGLIGRAEFAKRMSVEERFTLLDLVNRGIAACRMRNGLPELDDALVWLGEAPKASEKIKTLLELDGR